MADFKEVVPDSRFQANVNESLAEKAEPLPLGKITWMSPGLNNVFFR